jgi:hypothetical protein
MSKSRVDLLEKECTSCGICKPNTLEFYYKKKGRSLRAQCRECQNEIANAYRKHQRGEKKPRVEPLEKECVRCLVCKPNTEVFFYKKAAWKGRKAALRSECADCYSKTTADRRNVEKISKSVDLKSSALERQCTGCGVVKPNTADFFYAKAAWKGRRATLMSRCCDCHNKLGSAYRNQRKKVDPEGLRVKEREATRKHREQQKEKDPLRIEAKAQWRRWHLRAHWDMSPEDFDALLAQQNNACALCGTNDPGRKGWVIDHCHSTDRIRGILCTKCNTGVGLLGDNEEGLLLALVYLRLPPVEERNSPRQVVKRKPRLSEQRVCSECSATYLPNKPRQLTCSPQCSQKVRRSKEEPPKEVLAAQVWEHTIQNLGRVYNVSDVTVRNWCKRLGIEIPPRGYWLRATTNQKNVLDVPGT